jgi:protein subunit release factor B
MGGSDKTSSTDFDALERECDIEFSRASGPGGQHRNKTETAVRVIHRPSGVVAIASERRSQSRNRTLALKRLAAKLTAIERKRQLTHQRENRPATRPSRAANQRRVEQKRQRGEKKRARRKPRRSDDN